MAKLSARGRTELVRVKKERDIPAIVQCPVCQGTAKVPGNTTCTYCGSTGKTDSLTSWERTTLAFMSDRTILAKRVVKFRSDDRRHDYGWKVRGKVKEGVTPAAWKAAYENRDT